MHENLDVETSKDLEKELVKMLKVRYDIEPDKSLKVFKDAAFSDNPMERSDILDSVKV